MPPVEKRPQGHAGSHAARWRRVLEDPDQAARMFPSLAGAMAHPVERRRLLKLMAASVALGGLAGCDPASPDGEWVPAVVAPPGIVPGLPNFYATASLAGGTAMGIVVEHQMGRPVKVEGNPNHPASLGSTDALAQAMILDFYDPDRASGLMNQGQPSGWPSLLTALAGERARLTRSRGAGLRILTGDVVSPTLAASLDALLGRWPEARWVQWEPVSRDAVREGARIAYGRPVATLPRLERADVVLALESDLISAAPGHVRFARDFASRRNPARARMSRVYAAEPTPTLIGASADHRFVAGPAELHAAVMALADTILRGAPPGDAPSWVGPVAKDLMGAKGRAFIHAGPDLPAQTHALVHAMNEALGGRGATYDLIESPEIRPTAGGVTMPALLDDMRAGRVETLLMLDTNPVFTRPEFGRALGNVRFSLATSGSPDETAQAATWYVPMAHTFETWGDARAHDGTVTILQPQAMPLYDGRAVSDLLSLVLDGTPADPLALVRRTWRELLSDDTAWMEALANGVVGGTASATVDAPLRPEAAAAAPPAPARAATRLLFRPDPHLGDGRWANNPWLQELPRPLTKLTWDNPLLLSPQVARHLEVQNGDTVGLSAAGVQMLLPAWIVPGQAADCVVALLGFGRRTAGAVGTHVGTDFYPMRDAALTQGGPVDGVQIWKADGHVRMACTDHRDPMEVGPGDRARGGSLADFQEDPKRFKGEAPENSLYRIPPKGRVAWGMSVDLNACIGCNACVVACMAENNVPVVGRENVIRQREMHWLRIDRYYDGPVEHPDSIFQPMLCQHCEEAPCEVVCPVEAAVHDEEGLNLQVYNRCVGTRFCSNNCPYKVRRFNFGPYALQEPRPAISRNPDVTARSRGVMEKCTFCVQRIAQARIAHDRDGVPEQVVTACQAACPTQVFAFGDLHDPESDVVKRKASPLGYVLLPEQQTHPRLTYEARIRNPNPEIPV